MDKAKILAFMDKAIAAGEVFAPLTPPKADDLLLSIIRHLRSDETFLAVLDRFDGASAQGGAAQLIEAAPLIESLRRWSDEQETTEAATDPTSRKAKLLAALKFVLELAALFAKMKGVPIG